MPKKKKLNLFSEPQGRKTTKITQKSAPQDAVFSVPTMCLHCHITVEMFHERGADPIKGAWQCPRCGHRYLFAHWKIRRKSMSASGEVNRNAAAEAFGKERWRTST